MFTQILQSGLPDEETNIVHRGERCFAILNAFPVRHRAPPRAAVPARSPTSRRSTRTRARELWATVTDAVRAVKAAYRPEGVNVGVNLGRPAGGSVSEHLHVHVVPRWTGDANFMTAVANTRTLPEPLADTARNIRLAWPAGD